MRPGIERETEANRVIDRDDGTETMETETMETET